jgi:hypothetical protein
MGNNRICGNLPDTLGQLSNLQRIVLHQNRLTGAVPQSLSRLGCIVNLAGNPGLYFCLGMYFYVYMYSNNNVNM